MSKVIDNIEDIASIDSKSTISYVDSKPTGYKNYIINGNFDVWQRGTSFSGLANGSYSADRWVVYDSVGNINYNVIRNAGVFQGGYGATYTWNSGTGTRSVIQFIENVTKFKVGTQVTISFEAYTNSTPYTVDVAIQGVRGIWAAATAEVTSSIAITNAKTKYNVTLTIPDWTTIGIDYSHLEDTKLACKFTMSSSTNGKDFIISNVQIENGSVATPFEQRPYGLELSLCQRYYEILNRAVFTGRATSNGDFYGGAVYFRVTKRTFPTVTLTSMNIAGGTLGSVDSFKYKDALSIFSLGGSGFTSGQAVVGDVIITASAEL